MRILIATVTAGAGHLQAAAALEEAWRCLRPGDGVEKVDLLDLVPRLQRRVYVQGYVKLVKHAPELWGMVFKKTDNPALLRKVARLRRSFAGRTNKKFVRHLRRFRPDAVICTHYLPVEIMAHQERKGFDPLTVCVVTDFEAHALWMEPAVDLYCVAAVETRSSVVARGAPAADVTVTGIPIAAKFSEPVDPRAVRRRYGLRDDLPVILVLGGGFGMGPVAGILSALNQVGQECQVLVVAGSNARLRRELACADFRHPTRVLGFVTNMHELMTAADLIVSKPGGLTSSEALALGKPMFIMNPIPGQEAANSDFLLEHGAAVKVNRLEDVAFRLEQLLGSKKLREMGRAARALGHPEAARAVCLAVIDRLGARAA